MGNMNLSTVNQKAELFLRSSDSWGSRGQGSKGPSEMLRAQGQGSRVQGFGDASEMLKNYEELNVRRKSYGL